MVLHCDSVADNRRMSVTDGDEMKKNSGEANRRRLGIWDLGNNFNKIRNAKDRRIKEYLGLWLVPPASQAVEGDASRHHRCARHPQRP